MPNLGLQPYAHTLPPPTATRRLALLTCSPRARRQVAFTVVSPSCTRCGGPTRSPGSIPAARTPSATQASRLSLPPPRRLALLICSPCACRLPSPSPSRRHRVRGAAPTHTLSQQHPRGTHPVRAPSPRLSHTLPPPTRRLALLTCSPPVHAGCLRRRVAIAYPVRRPHTSRARGTGAAPRSRALPTLPHSLPSAGRPAAAGG